MPLWRLFHLTCGIIFFGVRIRRTQGKPSEENWQNLSDITICDNVSNGKSKQMLVYTKEYIKESIFFFIRNMNSAFDITIFSLQDLELKMKCGWGVKILSRLTFLVYSVSLLGFFHL